MNRSFSEQYAPLSIFGSPGGTGCDEVHLKINFISQIDTYFFKIHFNILLASLIDLPKGLIHENSAANYENMFVGMCVCVFFFAWNLKLSAYNG